MDNNKHRSIVEYQMKEYGHIELTVKEAMDKRNMSRKHLSSLTGLKYDTIHSYYLGKSVKKSVDKVSAPIMRVDLDTLSKICFCLRCGIDELIRYVPPAENGDLQ